MDNLVIFASGAGSNAAAIITYFKQSDKAKVALIVCSNERAGVLDIAKNEHIPFVIINKDTLSGQLLVEQIEQYKPALIILAGFLWKVPMSFIKSFRNNIVNIHPSLLPLYGGKGMYGSKVHNAVIDNGHSESGITIHFVNAAYDEGDIILQARCKVLSTDTAIDLADRIHKLEHFFLPRTVEYLLQQS